MPCFRRKSRWAGGRSLRASLKTWSNISNWPTATLPVGSTLDSRSVNFQLHFRGFISRQCVKKRRGVARDHAFLVRRKHPDRNTGRGCINPPLPFGIRLLVNGGAEPSAPGNNFLPGFRIALTDAAGEYEPLDAAHGGCERADLADNAVDEEVDGFTRLGIVGRTKCPHVGRDPGYAQEP